MPSLADLTNSLFTNLGLDLGDPLAVRNPEISTEILFLVDGLGADQFQIIGEKFPVFKGFQNHHKVSSLFPTTTVVNLTSMATGKLPSSHGMFGYTVRVPYSGTPERLLNGLKWDEKVDPVIWQDQETLFEKASQQGINVYHIAAKRYQDSGFTRAALRGGEYIGVNRIELIPEVAISQIKNSKQSKNFLYLYINHLDAAGHKTGLDSKPWWDAVSALADCINRLINNLPSNTRLWLTADHGMINSSNKLILGKDFPLPEKIALIGGEPRARHLYFAPDENMNYEESLESSLLHFKKYLGDKAQVYSRAQAMEKFFPGEIKVDKSLRIGDLMLIPNEDLLLLDPARAELEAQMIGHHGGLSPAEQEIFAASIIGLN
jgi:predicted AlkP superfamily pyrophosphatase or phosphodiesterase